MYRIEINLLYKGTVSQVGHLPEGYFTVSVYFDVGYIRHL